MKARELIALGTVILFILVVSNFTVTAARYVGFLSASAPARISLTVLDCEGCTPLDAVVSSIKGEANVVGETSLLGGEALAVAREMGISSIPAIIVEGDVEKISPSGFEEAGEMLVYESATPPYVDVASGETRGLVELIYLKTSDCEVCPDSAGPGQTLRARGSPSAATGKPTTEKRRT